MKTVQFGVTVSRYGQVTMDIPDEINTVEEAREYLLKNWANVPLPSSTSYVNDSDELDEESIEFVG